MNIKHITRTSPMESWLTLQHLPREPEQVTWYGLPNICLRNTDWPQNICYVFPRNQGGSHNVFLRHQNVSLHDQT